MKRLVLLVLILMVSKLSSGQINLINTLDNSYNTIELENEGLKFYKIHRKTNTIVIYNLNSTMFKVVKLDLPVHQILNQVSSISKYEFNNDDLIEIAYTTYFNESNEHIEGYSKMNSLFFTLIIQNENGKEILNVPGASHYEIKNNKSEKVLIVLKSKGKGKFSDMVSQIYSIHE
jgi:hypothetical protein